METQQRIERALAQLTVTVSALETRKGKVDDWQLEQRYVQRAASYFGRWLSQTDVLWPGRLNRSFEERLDATLSPDEKEQVLLLDAVILGKPQLAGATEDVLVALEISVTINQYDVVRVRERATLLRRAGWPVVAVVAGEEIEPTAAEAAKIANVAILQNGKRQGWDEAFAAA